MSGDVTNNSLVSVIVPVYNGDLYLSEAIESVLRQVYKPVEIIVVDDGSDDETPNIAQSYAEVRYMRQDNSGPSAARNTGIRAAHGKFIAYLDHDDIWLPSLLQVHISYLLSHPDIGFTICTGQWFLEEGVEKPAWVERAQLDEHSPLLSAQVLRRCVLERVGLFDPSYRLAEDTEWLFRAEEAGIAHAVLPDLVFRRRIHSSNASHDWQAAYRQLLRSTRAAMQRRRRDAME